MNQIWQQDPPQAITDGLIELHAAGESEVVAEEAGKLLGAFPESYVLWQIYGGVLLTLGLYGAAEMALGQAAALRPDLADALANHATALRAVERIDEAETQARAAVRLAPRSVRAVAELTAVLLHRSDMRAVVKLCDRILRLDKTAVSALNNKGVALQAMGRWKAARQAYEAAIRHAPGFAEAHRNLASAKRWEAEDTQLAQMHAIYDDPAIALPDRRRICMALFTAYDRLDRPAQAWEFLSEGNALRRAEQGYDPARDVALFDRIRQVFDRMTPLDVDPDEAGVVPIFILGMPRSGTTLAEQIISAHGAVTGGGEQGVVNALVQPFLAGDALPNAAGLRQFRKAYLEALTPLAQGRRYITDKMPHNFRYAGLIAAALPEAKIVHMVRDARAVCWSNLSHNFVAEGLGYANDPADVVAYHGLYDGLMQHWQMRWPGRLRLLDYEALVQDPEAQTRGLIADLGLAWDAACLAPEENRRAVQTASTAQVRRRVYTGSSEAWRRYAPMLDAAFAGLQGDGKRAAHG